MENKKIADRLLIVLLTLFIINILIRIYIYNSYYMKLISFVLEAALVGGIADWFAITALFKKPLGFPWHTAIIPRNRDKVIAAVAGMVENELLSPKTLKSKISEINIINGLIHYIENNKKLENIFLGIIEKNGTRFIDNLDTEEISAFVEKVLKDKLIQLDLSLYLSRLLKFAVKSNECEKLLAIILGEIINKVQQETTRDGINKIINEAIEDNLGKTSGFKKVMLELALGIAKDTNSINTAEVSEAIQEQVLLLLDGLKDETNPEHIKMLSKIEDIVVKLQNDEKIIDSVEKWKLDTIDKISFSDEINKIINNIVDAVKYSIKKENLKEDKVFAENQNGQTINEIYNENARLASVWIRNQLNVYWKSFKTNEEAKKTIDGYIKEVIYKIIKAEHSLIGVMVKKVLNNMTDASLNEFINAKAGNDLHWIRINGCMIGAIFGFIVYVFINNFYLPILSKLFNI